MPDYKELRRFYFLQIDQNLCRCILSGLLITNKKQFSLEHYVPCCRGDWDETHALVNVFPAYKIINNLKGRLLPCEWEMTKKKLMLKALDKNKLKHADRVIVEDALANMKNYIINPCDYCINNIKCNQY